MRNFIQLILLLPIFIFGQTQIGSNINGYAANDESGSSVSISDDGTIIAIGAPKNDGNGNESGHVRVFQLSSGSWSQLGDDINGEANGDQFGYSVSLSGDGTRLAIGGRYNDGSIANGSGHVRVYEYGSGSWSQIGADIDGAASFDEFGFSVSLSQEGTYLAVGARLNDNNGRTSAGHVRVYGINGAGNAWNKLGDDIEGEAEQDQFGFSVAINDGNAHNLRVAIGARNNTGSAPSSGHVRVFELDSEQNWSQLGSDIDGEADSDASCNSVAISNDGTKVAIGALYNDGNGDTSGHVRVYQYSSSSWSQLGADIDGESSSDESGYSVALSEDGNALAIGAPKAGSSAGHVRIFKYVDGWVQRGDDIDEIGRAHV